MKLRPARGIGSLDLGMSRDEVRVALGAEPVVLDRFDSPVDDYPGLGFQISYDARGRCNFIEVTEPATLEFDGLRLLPSSAEVTLAAIARKGIEPTEIEGSEYHYFDSHGFALRVIDSQVTGVSVSAIGYYADTLAE